jgi:hypothetical protein
VMTTTTTMMATAVTVAVTVGGSVGLVDQGSRGGGGKIWQRGGPSGAVGAVVAVVAGALVSTAAAEDQYQPLVCLFLGSSRGC